MSSEPDFHRPEVHKLLDRYWRSNVLIMTLLLILWALAGLGCGILFADWLNIYRFPTAGYPLGFWFAQQGSIIIFVFLILSYCLLMNWLDKKHHQDLEEIENESGEKP